jgi:hypothetical protein
MSNHAEPIASPVLKAATAWGAVGITSWADAASFLAFVYTLVLLGEWIWKRAGRRFAERRGWVKPRSGSE